MLSVDERFFSLIWLALIGLFRSRASLQAEILTLRHQLNVLRRQSPQRLNLQQHRPSGIFRVVSVGTGMLDALKIVRPETMIRWHRTGFRSVIGAGNQAARWPPKTLAGSPSAHSQDESRQPLWAHHGFMASFSSSASMSDKPPLPKYMARGRRPPSQGWKTFLHNLPTHRVDGPIRGSDNSHSECLSGADSATLIACQIRTGSNCALNGEWNFAPTHRAYGWK